MGQTLSEPDTTKDTAYCENHLYRVGSSCMQGWRINMEDSHTHILSLPDDPGTAFFAVYDGHGGASIAEYAGKNLHKVLTKTSAYQAGQIDEALQHAFLKLDDIMLHDEALKHAQAGSTAVATIIKDNALYCANVGDSRAIASVNGRVEQLSFDHKPTNEVEYSRITAAGGWVEYNRVNGNLALSRALGDFSFKRNGKKLPEEQIVTAFPDVEVRTITDDWEFIVIACDGIWDVMKNEEVLEFVRQNIAVGYEPEEICEALMTQCLAPDCLMGGLGCDNMTVVIVGLLHDRPYSDLVQRCAKSYAKPDRDGDAIEDAERMEETPATAELEASDNAVAEEPPADMEMESERQRTGAGEQSPSASEDAGCSDDPKDDLDLK